MKTISIMKYWIALVALLACVPTFAGEITVSAAASLTNAFKDIARQYESQYPDAKIYLNFAGSGSLLQQIDKGAPVDVFASADQKTMDMAEEKNLIVKNTRQDFVQNKLVLIVPQKSTLKATELNDLMQPSFKRIALSNPKSVPVGRYSKAALEEAGLWENIQPKIINTQHVRQSLDYVAREEVDAGFVYETDAAVMKDKVSILFKQDLSEPILYPIAMLAGAKDKEEAKRFLKYIQSSEAQDILRQYGFSKP